MTEPQAAALLEMLWWIRLDASVTAGAATYLALSAMLGLWRKR